MANTPLPPLEDLQRLAEEWKVRLELSDWKVICRIVRRSELAYRWATAEAWVNVEQRRVQVVYRSDVDADPEYDGDPAEIDWEETTVHELLHCVFPSSIVKVKDGGKKTIYEQGINSMARALVKLHRASKRTEEGS